MLCVKLLYNNYIHILKREKIQMLKKSTNLFYVREIQLNLYFEKNINMLALFDLENLFYKTYDPKVEKILIIVKLKWLYDEIKNENFSNEITKRFKCLAEKKIKNKTLELIETFIEILNSENDDMLFNNFKKFNLKFNNIIKSFGYSFNTSVIYQFTQFKYQSCSQHLNLKNNFNVQDDLLEYAFVNIISNKKNVSKLKIRKIQYLYQVIICYIKRCF